ncbi:ATP-binding protein [Stackebrandtia nassauensis]|uniref:Orc1-like AAA ATPase domain-containing protein n=1 Tax=Stackebrandtia nassauensis (strain DSM 44728 / CIP 108903 / NRRL B-16338 / NBRC 102104 / LLR-40K-21) TaxID=446470 RepID=D3PWN7_STANL|nr:ATP-binding protein [Stackebrandtia nassauensis]ADD43259.1 hypothetical protein Snas_3599 [Stackebrandtia nassauensis DSM 44728]
MATKRGESLARSLEALGSGYGVEHISEPTMAQLRRIDEFAFETKNLVRIIHVISHGEVDGQDQLHLVARNGFGYRTNMTSLCRSLADLAGEYGHILLVLDLCHAGTAVRDLTHRQFGDRLWVAAAAGADRETWDGVFTQAFADTLMQIAKQRSVEGTADQHVFDPSAPYVSMAFVRSRVVENLVKLWPEKAASRAPDPWFHGAFSKGDGGVQGVPFFANPRFDPLARDAVTARQRISSGLHEYLDIAHFQDRVGTHFTGRRTLLTELGNWRADRDTNTPVRLIVGGAGVGKSSVLGVIVLTGHPHVAKRPEFHKQLAELRRRLPSEFSQEFTEPIAAVHARQLRTDDVVGSLMDQLYGQSGGPKAKPPDSTVGNFISWLRTTQHPPLLIVDAIDEAADSLDLIRRLIIPLTRTAVHFGAVRLLLALRTVDEQQRRLAKEIASIASAGDDRTIKLHDIDLSEPAELHRDLRRFLIETLETDDNRAWRQARVASVAQHVATQLTRSPEGDWGAFLVAVLFSQYLLRQTEHDLDAALQTIPRTLPEVLELDLAMGNARRRQQRRAVLAALAHVKGAGMPSHLVHLLAQQVFGGGDNLDTATLLTDPQDLKVYLRTSVDTNNTTLFRLFHQALVDHLLAYPRRSAHEGLHT